MAIMQAGIESEDYGDYLAAITARGYDPSSPTAGTLTGSQAEVLEAYQQETLRKVSPGYLPPSGTPLPAFTTQPVYAGGETIDVVQTGFNGLGQPGAEMLPSPLPVPGITATPTAFPIVGAVIAGAAVIAAIRAIAGRFLTLGVFKMLVTRFGPAAVKLAIGTAVFFGLMNLADAGMSDENGMKIPVRHKRLSIGLNPRVRTLQRVAKRTQKLLKKHEKVIRAFLPKPSRQYGQVPSSMLSAAEKKLLRG